VSPAAGLAAVDDALGVAAPLPRSNGELVFEEVWQGRVLGLGVVVLEHTGAWSEFRDHLVAAIAAHEPAPGESVATAYYTAWLDAIEALLAARGLTWALPPTTSFTRGR
jgi:nitrile hydratase accessory protein